MTQDQFGATTGISEAALAAFDDVSSAVEADVTSMCMANDNPATTMGDNAESMIRSGMTFVTRMLRTTLAFGAKEIVDDEMEWGKVRLPVYGVSMDMVLRNLTRYNESLARLLPEAAYREIEPVLTHMQALQKKNTT